MSEIKLLVLNNGLQIIGGLEDRDDKSGVILISRPVQLVILPNDDPAGKPGQVGMAFAPFLQYTEEWTTGVKFVVTDVLTVVSPIRNLVNSYNTTFGSGILLPPGVGQA
jgi:hypothetical protein